MARRMQIYVVYDMFNVEWHVDIASSIKSERKGINRLYIYKKYVYALEIGWYIISCLGNASGRFTWDLGEYLDWICMAEKKNVTSKMSLEFFLINYKITSCNMFVYDRT